MAEVASQPIVSENSTRADKSLPELPKPVEKPKLGLDDFHIHRTIGTGSFGRVHLVKEKSGSKYYAMKALVKSDIVKNRQVEHTVNEKKILEMLDHPFLVKLQATFQDSKNLFFVLEYIQGGELFTYLRKCGVRLF
jgi:serine/threonine protein kinase